MQNIDQASIAKFAGLVTKIWSDPKLAQAYQANPDQVLSAHGIALPDGVPTPVIPDRPAGDIGLAWQNMSFDHMEVSVKPLDPGGTAAGVSVSSLACIACPVSCFSSLSNS